MPCVFANRWRWAVFTLNQWGLSGQWFILLSVQQSDSLLGQSSTRSWTQGKKRVQDTGLQETIQWYTLHALFKCEEHTAWVIQGCRDRMSNTFPINTALYQVQGHHLSWVPVWTYFRPSCMCTTQCWCIICAATPRPHVTRVQGMENPGWTLPQVQAYGTGSTYTWPPCLQVLGQHALPIWWESSLRPWRKCIVVTQLVWTPASGQHVCRCMWTQPQPFGARAPSVTYRVWTPPKACAQGNGVVICVTGR